MKREARDLDDEIPYRKPKPATHAQLKMATDASARTLAAHVERIRTLEERVARLEKMIEARALVDSEPPRHVDEVHGIILLDDSSVDMRKYIAIILKNQRRHSLS